MLSNALKCCEMFKMNERIRRIDLSPEAQMPPSSSRAAHRTLRWVQRLELLPGAEVTAWG